MASCPKSSAPQSEAELARFLDRNGAAPNLSTVGVAAIRGHSAQLERIARRETSRISARLGAVANWAPEKHCGVRPGGADGGIELSKWPENQKINR